MNPATGFRGVKLSPHEMLDAVTATEDLFVLAPLGAPRVDPERWSLMIDRLVEGEVARRVRAIEATGAGQPQGGARNAIHTVRVVVR